MNKQFIGGKGMHWSCAGLSNPEVRICNKDGEEFEVCGRNKMSMEANENSLCKGGKFKNKAKYVASTKKVTNVLTVNMLEAKAEKEEAAKAKAKAEKEEAAKAKAEAERKATEEKAAQEIKELAEKAAQAIKKTEEKSKTFAKNHLWWGKVF